MKQLVIKNQYGNEFGYHTPKRSKLNFQNIIKESNIDFVDCSWHNDQCDSIWNEVLDLTIMLPNSENNNEDNEEFNTFSITEIEDRLFSFDTLIEFIKSL